MPPMLLPQWQMNTPIRGSNSATSSSSGYTLGETRVPRSSEIMLEAMAAAPDAWATVSGMSFGAEFEPQTNMPGLLVDNGSKAEVWQKPCSLSSMPSLAASSFVCLSVSKPIERITMS